MARVMITCPTTGKPIPTGLTAEPETFGTFSLESNTLGCPECGQFHTWSKTDAYLEMAGDVESPTPHTPITGGPWIQAALFCERLLAESDGVWSAVRIVDEITMTIVGANAPAQIPAFEYELVMVLMFKPGDARGEADVIVQVEAPDGRIRPGPTIRVVFEGPVAGVNVRTPIHFRFDLTGLYWFNVWCAGVLLTRMPLRVVHHQDGAQTP